MEDFFSQNNKPKESDFPRPVKQTVFSKRNPLLSQDCQDMLNYRIEQEEFSSRLYLSMSLWLNDNGYKNSAALWKKYSDEEMSHADWSRTYLLSMGVQPITPALKAPGDSYIGLPDIIRKSFDHEVEVTKQCKALADKAFSGGDHMLYTLTHKYLAEQVEEHDKMQNHIDQLVAFGEDKIALRLFDEALK
jgi:ferritin